MSRFASLLLSLLLLISITGTARSATDHQHDFDFEFGSWKATLKMQPHPLTNSSTWITYTGTSVVRKIWDGRANLGELEVGNATDRIEALSFRLYDPQQRTWNVYFANARNGVLTLPPTVGRFSGNRGEFYDTESYRGKPIRVRFVFTITSADAFGFVQSFSADNGKTWIPNWIATFTRYSSGANR